MRPDLALFLHSFEMGGAQKRTLALAAEIARRGRRVDLVVARDEGPLRSAVPAAVAVRALGGVGAGARIGRDAALAWSVPALATYLRKEQPRVLAAAANHGAFAAIAAHGLAGRDTALILRVSNPLVGGRNRLKDRLRRWLFRRLASRVDAFACVSAQTRREVVALAPAAEARAKVVVNPVAPPAEAIPPARSSDPSHPALVGIGRLVPQKGFDVLIRALARLGPEVRLTLVGEGPERSALQALATEVGVADRVVFAGEHADPLPWMAAADAVVLPSRFEGMPGVLIEAMACGRAVVASDLPSVREVLQGLDAPLVPAGDPEALAAGVSAALTRPIDAEAYARRARRFSAEGAADDFLALMAAAEARRAGA